jgi:hypothetical protein
MQQIVDARKGIVHAEFLLQNAAGLLGTQRTYAISGSGTREESLFELRLLGGLEFAGTTRLGFGANGWQTSIPIGIDPPLHEVLAAIESVHDRLGALAFQRQENGSIAIPLFGLTLSSAHLAKLFKIAGLVWRDIHLAPPVSLRVCQINTPGATPF